MRISVFVIGTLGIVLLWAVDWRAAVGAFLLLWANNVERAA